MKNQRSSSLSILAAAAMLLSSCSSVRTKVDSGPIKASTFSFINTGTPAAAAFADNREQVHAMIQKSVTDSLAAKGLTRVASGSDVTVAYLVVVGNNGSTELINKYFGYSPDAFALHEKVQDAYSKNKTPNYFEAGTLVVDVVDSRTFKVLRRASVTRPILKNPAAEVRAANIQEAVNAVLAGLRIDH